MRRAKISLSLFFIPALTLILLFVILPVFDTVYISFFSSEGEFVGLNNYFSVLGRRDMVNLENLMRARFPMGALTHNLLWILIHLPLSLFSGLVLAIILRDVKGSSIVKSIIFLGMVTPMIVGGLIIRFTFDKNVGVVNGLLRFLGLGQLVRSWTVFPDTALLSLIFGSVWLWTGFSMILYSAGLSTIPKDYYEAAKLDGSTPFRTFYRITLPLLKPITVTVVTLTILWELKIFDIVYVATLGGPGGSSNVLALLMYNIAFRAFDFNSAAVVATFLTLLTLLVMVGMARYVVKR